MVKISIFVEGQTERVFLEKLLDEYLSSPDYIVESHKLIGDKIIEVRKRETQTGTQIYILIFEIACGDRVVSMLLEKAEQMIDRKGYNHLIALRDLHPKQREEKNRVIEATQKEIDKCQFGDKLKHVLAIMEIEAWFLADYNLFKNIDSKLTPEYIKQETGKDLVEDDPEEAYGRPSLIINEIYRLINKKYKKREKQSYKITHSIDYNFLCLDQKELQKIDSFFFFLKCFDEALQTG